MLGPWEIELTILLVIERVAYVELDCWFHGRVIVVDSWYDRGIMLIDSCSQGLLNYAVIRWLSVTVS